MTVWATKLAPPSAQPRSQSPNRRSRSPTRRSKKKLEDDPEKFNGQEILEYLHRNFQKHMANVNASNDTVVYKSLESANQWKTKAPTQKKNHNSKYNPRNVIRSDQKSNSLDLLFELNRSIYQQQQQKSENKGQYSKNTSR